MPVLRQFVHTNIGAPISFVTNDYVPVEYGGHWPSSESTPLCALYLSRGALPGSGSAVPKRRLNWKVRSGRKMDPEAVSPFAYCRFPE